METSRWRWWPSASRLAGLLPDGAIDLPPHFFGPGGAALAGLVFLGGGVWLRRSGGGGG